MEMIKKFLSAPKQYEDAFWESDVLIWIDWREYDEDIICYFNEKLPAGDKIDFACKDTDKERGVNIILKKGDACLPIPYADAYMDRDTTLISIQKYIAPKYQIRCYLGSLVCDTLAFCMYPAEEWNHLEQEFGAETVARYFVPVQEGRKLFEMDMDEVYNRLEQMGMA